MESSATNQTTQNDLSAVKLFLLDLCYVQIESKRRAHCDSTETNTILVIQEAQRDSSILAAEKIRKESDQQSTTSDVSAECVARCRSRHRRLPHHRLECLHREWLLLHLLLHLEWPRRECRRLTTIPAVITLHPPLPIPTIKALLQACRCHPAWFLYHLECPRRLRVKSRCHPPECPRE